jgi:dihydroorotase-like cyclic amidohydrolase
MMIMPLREFDKMESSSKTANDQAKALLDGRIDVVATDHAPTLEEKKQPYLKAFGRSVSSTCCCGNV